MKATTSFVNDYARYEDALTYLYSELSINSVRDQTYLFLLSLFLFPLSSFLFPLPISRSTAEPKIQMSESHVIGRSVALIA